MGKLTITGEAEKEVPYDAMDISIHFQAHAEKSEAAIQKALNQCEEFLEAMAKSGMAAADVFLGSNQVNQNYDDGKLDARATRSIKIRHKFDMRFLNHIMDVVSDKGYDVDVDSDFWLTTKKALRDELQKNALADSRAKAESIAETLGQTVKGIESAKINGSGMSDMDWPVCESDQFYSILGETHAFSRSNQIKSPLAKERASIEVVWLIE